MDHPDFSNWSQEEKEEYANRRRNEMRIKNEAIQKRYAEVQVDRIAAENRNSSVTNTTRKQEISSVRCKAEIINTDKPQYSREWDRGKAGYDDWDDQSHKAHKNYRTDEHERQLNFKSERKGHFRDEKNYHNRHDHMSEKKSNRNYKSYSNDHCSRSYYDDDSSKQNHHKSFESSKFQQSHEKFKKYFPTHSQKYQSKNYSNSSSTDSALWHSERLNEDKNKYERTQKWVQSVRMSNLDQENNCINNENEKNTSPKGKCETVSDKCLNENDLPNLDVSSRRKSKDIPNLNSQKFDCDESNIMEQNLPEQKREFGRKSYTKFDRWNHSDHSSEDSDCLDHDLLRETKPEINYNSKSEKHYYNEKESKCTDGNDAKYNFSSQDLVYEGNRDETGDPFNSNRRENYTPGKSDSRHNLKLQDLSSEEDRSEEGELSNSDRKEVKSARGFEVIDLVSEGDGSENRELCNSNRRYIEFNSTKKSFSCNTGSHYVKKSFGNTRPNTARKFSSHTTGYNISSESAHNHQSYNFANNEKNRKKGAKSKRNPDTNSQYNSNDSYKNDHITKQRKCDEWQSDDDSWSNSLNKGVKYEKKNFDKKPNFSISHSLKQDAYSKKGSKTKWNTETNSQYNSNDRYNKNDHVTNQGKCHEWQSDDSQNNSMNRGMKNESKNFDKKPNFNVSHSLKQDAYSKKDFKIRQNLETHSQYNSSDVCKNNHFTKQRKFDKWQSDSWNSSVNNNRCVKNKDSSFDRNMSDFDDGWGQVDQPYDDDGIWSSADQSDIKWKINDDNDRKKKEETFVFDSHCNKGGPKKFSVKNPTASDDGGWSTVEEGEVRSDDDLEENKEHVN